MSTGSPILTPTLCRMARAALGLGVRDLAILAKVSSMTVTRFENGKSQGYPDTLAKVRAAFEKAGVDFIAENGGGAGVRLKAKGGTIPGAELNASNDE